MKQLIRLIFLLGFTFNTLSGMDTDSLFKKGVSALNSKDFAKSAETFESALAYGREDAAIFYNLGTAYLHLNKLGKSRLMLEKARVRRPHNKAISNNISILKDRLNTSIISLDPFFLTKWWKGLYNIFNPNTWAIISVIFTLIFLAIIYLKLFKQSYPISNWIPSFAAGLLLISITSGIMRYNYIFKNEYYVIMKASKVYENASKDANTLKILSPGVKVNFKESNSEWIKISTDDLEEGWILESNVEKV